MGFLCDSRAFFISYWWSHIKESNLLKLGHKQLTFVRSASAFNYILAKVISAALIYDLMHYVILKSCSTLIEIVCVQYTLISITRFNIPVKSH